jgi:hypothetical protein
LLLRPSSEPAAPSEKTGVDPTNGMSVKLNNNNNNNGGALGIGVTGAVVVGDGDGGNGGVVGRDVGGIKRDVVVDGGFVASTHNGSIA